MGFLINDGQEENGRWRCDHAQWAKRIKADVADCCSSASIEVFPSVRFCEPLQPRPNCIIRSV